MTQRERQVLQLIEADPLISQQDIAAKLGIDLSHALRIPGGVTSTYLYLADDHGEMALAVSDMEICKKITPAYLSAQLPLLQNAQVVVSDTNIPEESLRFLAENCTAPLFIDPVSTVKAEKIRPILSKIHTLKPNRLEAELLSGFYGGTAEDYFLYLLVLQCAYGKGNGCICLTRSGRADGEYHVVFGESLHQLQLVFAAGDDWFSRHAEHDDVARLFRLRGIAFDYINDNFLFQ